MGLNTMRSPETRDKQYDKKKSTSSSVDKVVEDTKNKVRDIQNKK